MANLVVGDNDCAFVDVCNTMFESVTNRNLFERWRELARYLMTPEGEIDKINSRFNMEMEEQKGVIIRILTGWRARMGSEAKLGFLVDRLMKMGLNDVAETLRKEFYDEGAQGKDSDDFKIGSEGSNGVQFQPRSNYRIDLDPPSTSVSATLPKNITITKNQLCNNNVLIVIIIAATIIIVALIMYYGGRAMGMRM